ncbi:hypothetical protein K2173_010852 [Erythroxylum novogranatense]|uniref:GATA-type domain-containing protein n=1 Tax=Erythroxylum novogranatense TaxID=1862640 RepID=A0AAV8SZT6_9ROSI|nr:hypothetical protein K2173_010852 [Erythroxylum novogranatense]
MDSLEPKQTTTELANTHSLNVENSGVDLALNLGLSIGEDENKPRFEMMVKSMSMSPNVDMFNFLVDQLNDNINNVTLKVRGKTFRTNHRKKKLMILFTQIHNSRRTANERGTDDGIKMSFGGDNVFYYEFLDENRTAQNDVRGNASLNQYAMFGSFYGAQNLGDPNKTDHQMVSDNHFYVGYISGELKPSSMTMNVIVDLNLSLAPPVTAMNKHYVHQPPAVTKLRSKVAREQFEFNKRCANHLCNTNVTPLWRRGPLGRRTLCNACGIKYRKEENPGSKGE